MTPQGGEPTLILKTDINGNELWRKIITKQPPNLMRSTSVLQDSASKKIILTGQQSIGNSSHSSILILDSLGNKILHTSYNNANGGAAGKIVQLKDKNFVTSCQWSVNINNFIYSPLVVKFDINGNIIWSRKLIAGYLNTIRIVCELENGDLVGIGWVDTVYYGAKKFSLWCLTVTASLNGPDI